jgi:hypothetical protein
VRCCCRPFDAPIEVLQDAGVELGSNYDWPIVTDSEARAHVVHACHVIERCITARTGSEGDRWAVCTMASCSSAARAQL